MPFLLDTSVLIDVLRGRPAMQRVRAMRASRDVPFTCAVVADEVHRGLRENEVAAASGLLAGLRIAPLGTVEGSLSGVWRREYAARGITLSQSDTLIAAAALSVGATLITGNPKDFPMDRVSVVHWPVGE